ncbi:septum formation family protein [Streptomyces sp. NPDC006879]|uniref:septum formation family protein n=1 Tax=Streptomyces sp. NPDC006879 TaxID=3364767 RepID=UPI003679ED73
MALVSSLVLVAGVAYGGEGLVAGFRGGLQNAGLSRSTMDLATGTCFDVPGGDLRAEFSQVAVAGCQETHDGEVYATYRVPQRSGARYPGEEAMWRIAEEQCTRLQDGYTMDTWAVPRTVSSYFMTPSQHSWDRGDRAIACAFGSTDGALTESLRRDASSLNEHQLVYLRAANATSQALAGVPTTKLAEDLPSYRGWALRVSAAFAEHARLLKDHQWPASARRNVAARQRQLASAVRLWDRASRSSRAEVFWQNWGVAERASDLQVQTRDAKARAALGLDTTPPVHEETAERDARLGADPTPGAR